MQNIPSFSVDLNSLHQTFIAFKNVLKPTEEVEKTIPLNNNRFSKHKDKWSKLYPL